jgi:hypothetical protein
MEYGFFVFPDGAPGATHARTMHIDIRYHCIRELVEEFALIGRDTSHCCHQMSEAPSDCLCSVVRKQTALLRRCEFHAWCCLRRTIPVLYQPRVSIRREAVVPARFAISVVGSSTKEHAYTSIFWTDEKDRRRQDILPSPNVSLGHR